MEKRPALGKVLSALIPDVPEVRPGFGPTEVDVDLISPSEHQPRHQFEDVRLDELARSIKANDLRSREPKLHRADGTIVFEDSRGDVFAPSCGTSHSQLHISQ